MVHARGWVAGSRFAQDVSKLKPVDDPLDWLDLKRTSGGNQLKPNIIGRQD